MGLLKSVKFLRKISRNPLERVHAFLRRHRCTYYLYIYIHILRVIIKIIIINITCDTRNWCNNGSPNGRRRSSVGRRAIPTTVVITIYLRECRQSSCRPRLRAEKRKLFYTATTSILRRPSVRIYR